VLRDRYVIEARLGTGGMGTVYKALDKFRSDLAETNRHVAIKILNDDITTRPEVFAKLRREFYCAQSLSHRNIVRVYELDRDGDLAFFTMEFLEGEQLSRIIERFAPGTVTRSYAWRVVREVGAALTHAHARDVVHADLKPQNVLITLSGDVRLLDFGTSSPNVRSHPGPDMVPAALRYGPTALTPAYACCELLEGRQPDPRDDLFAFACLTYELLTGEHPFGQRRSTEARDQGISPKRPDNIGEQQWKTLSLGLAFARADRSMAVRDWVLAINQPDELPALLDTQPVRTRATSVDTQPVFLRAPPADTPGATGIGIADIDPDPASALHHDVPPVLPSSPEWVAVRTEGQPVGTAFASRRAMLVGALVLAALMIWVASHRRAAEAPAVPSPAVAQTSVPRIEPAATSMGTPVAPPGAAPVETPSSAAAAPAPAPVETPPPVAAAPVPVSRPSTVLPAAKPKAVTPAMTVVANAQPLRPAAKAAAALKVAVAPKRPDATKPAERPSIGIERPKYWVRAGRHFAEVHVVRAEGARGDASFVWWTEAGTARPDEDFFMQPKTTQTFSSGVSVAALFIRMVPNPLRRKPRTFYVLIGHPSPGHVLGRVTKVPILVLPRGR
jgi:serine/threonine protein kinase